MSTGTARSDRAARVRPPEMGLLRTVLARVDGGVARVELAVSIVTLCLVVLSTSLGVLFRYGLDSPLTWSNELGMLSLLWLTFVGAALLYRERGHIAVDMLSQSLPSQAQRTLSRVLIVLMATSIGIVGWNMLILIPLQHEKVITALDVPRSAYGVPVLWMSLSMVLASIRHLLNADAAQEEG